MTEEDTPILIMDVWEHAFIKDYAPADRPKYIEAFFSNIDWDAVSGRLQNTAGSAGAKCCRAIICREIKGNLPSGSKLR